MVLVIDDKQQILKYYRLFHQLDKTLAESSNAVHVGLSNLGRLKKLPEPLYSEEDVFHFKPHGIDMPPDDRKAAFKDWLLQKVQLLWE